MFIIELEQTVLNSVNWNINLQTPNEILICIFKELYPQINLYSLNEESSQSDEVNKFQLALSLIKYCINEYSIYKKYNEYIITISSILYMLRIKKEIFLVQILRKAFEADLPLIDKCFWEIDTEFNKEEEHYESEEQKVFVDPCYPLYVDHYFCEAEIKQKLLCEEALETTKPNSDKSFDKNAAYENKLLNPFAKNSFPNNNSNTQCSPVLIKKAFPNAKSTELSANRYSECDFNKNNNDENQQNSDLNVFNSKEQVHVKSIVFDEITPIKKSILSPGRLFFSNIQKLNFSAGGGGGNLNSGVKLNKEVNYEGSNFRNRSESFVSTAPGDQTVIDYKSLPNKNLFLNADYNLKFFEDNSDLNINNNNNSNNLKLSSSDLIMDKVENDFGFHFDQQGTMNCDVVFASSDINNNLNIKNAYRDDYVFGREGNRRFSLLKKKRKKYSNKNLLLCANKNKAKIFQEDKESQVEEEKENNFSSANIKNIKNSSSFSSFENKISNCEDFENNNSIKQTKKKSRLYKKIRNRKCLEVNDDDSGKSDKLVV